MFNGYKVSIVQLSPRDQVYNTVPMVLTTRCAYKFVKRVDLMLSVFNHTHKKGYTKEFLEVTDMFITLIMVMVSQMYSYVQTHQIVSIEHVCFFCISIIPQKSCLKQTNKKSLGL